MTEAATRQQAARSIDAPGEIHAPSIVPRDRTCAAVAGQILARRTRTTPEGRPRTPRRLPRAPRQVRERRKSERVAVACQIKFRHSGTPDATGKVIDLSGHGLFIQTPRALYPGTIIAGALRAPDGDDRPEIGFVGEVVRRSGRRHGSGFGVRFIFMTPSDHSRLRSVVASATEPD